MKLFAKKASVGGDAIYLTVSKIIVLFIGMITSMLLARFRTLEEYGTYSQIIMITDLVSTILMLGLPNSINYFLAKARTDEEKQRFMSVYITLSGIFTFVIAVCLFLALPVISEYFKNPAITTFSYVFAIYPWSSLMINSLSNTCIVYGKTNRLIIYNIIYTIVTLIILLITKALGMTFRQYMALYMLIMFVFGSIALGWMKKLVKTLKLLLSMKIIKEILVFSIPMGLASVVGTLNTELDKLVIGRFFTTEEYAIFANAAKELPVTILATSLTAVLLPRFVRLIDQKCVDEAIKLWKYAASLSFCFMTLIVGGFFTFAPDIMSLFYSEKYVTDGGVLVFRIYSLILLFRALYWGIILNATGQTKFVFYSSLLTLGLNLIGNIVSCYFIGFTGPAISSLVVIAIMACIQLWFSCRIINYKFSKVLPWKTIFTYIIETIIFSCIFATVRYKLIVNMNLNRSVLIIISMALGVVWTLVYVWTNKKDIIMNWKKLNKFSCE